MEDYLIRIIAKNLRLRAMATIVTKTTEEAITRHQQSDLPLPESTQLLLGELFAAGALFGGLIKIGQRTALKFSGSSPLKLIVESDHKGEMRGYINKPEEPISLDDLTDLRKLLGAESHLTVIKDLQIKELHQGVVSLTNGNMGSNLTHYLHQSEQLPSWVQTASVSNEAGTLIAAGGILIQAMPDYAQGAIEQLQERAEELPPLAALLAEGKTAEQLLELLFAGHDYHILMRKDIQFRCDCNQERVIQALVSLGREELKEMAASEEETIIACHFCRQSYLITTNEINQLLDRLS